MAESSKVKLYDARNFTQYYVTLESKCMKTPEAAQVLLGIYKDPIRELETLDKTNYDKVTALIAAHNANRNATLPEGEITLPNVEEFRKDPITKGKQFVLLVNTVNDFDSDRKAKKQSRQCRHDYLERFKYTDMQ